MSLRDKRRSFLILVITSLLLHLASCADDETVIIETKQGKLAGSTLLSREGRKYFAFKGITYGKIVKRFEPAELFTEKWEGVKDATEFGPVCPQFHKASQTVIGNEECLSLQIYTPSLKDNSQKLPVVVFVHGGAYQYGTGNDYGGDYFADSNTILVALNYRLGALGFLSTGDEVIQGNAGIKDVSLALRWINANVEDFGGDRNLITLMGTSAGAALVSFQIISPMSRGLFHRAQIVSGSVLNPWSLHPSPAKTAHELAEHLDCPKEPSEALAECLRNTDFKKIIQIRLTKWHIDPLCTFSPVVEKLRPGQSSSEVALAEDPLTLLKEGRFEKVPIVAGVTEDEGLLFHAAGIVKDSELQRNMNEDWNFVAPITLLYDNAGYSKEELVDISRAIRGFYFGQQTIGRETFNNITNLYSDRYFNHGVKKQSILQAKFTPVYAFILGFNGEWSILNLFYGDAYPKPMGVSHGDDMRNAFNSPRFRTIRPGSVDEEFSKSYIKLLTSFARTGNLMNSMQSSNVPWFPISIDEIKRNKLKWYYLDLQPRVMREPFTERLEFWDKMQAQLENLTKTESSSDQTAQHLEL